MWKFDQGVGFKSLMRLLNRLFCRGTNIAWDPLVDPRIWGSLHRKDL